TERVTVTRDDFGLGWGGVTLGEFSSRVNQAGQWGDRIGNPAALIHKQMRLVQRLPGVIHTPQELYWQDATGSWKYFASVWITFMVRTSKAGRLEAITVDNDVKFIEPITDPAPDGGRGGM